jgi:hypothetical protein
MAHMGLSRVGAVSLLVVVLRYSQALWAQWVDFDAPSATFARALCAAATFFGGAPRRFVFEEPDCRILRWDGRAEHFADVLQAVARHLGYASRRAAHLGDIVSHRRHARRGQRGAASRAGANEALATPARAGTLGR